MENVLVELDDIKLRQQIMIYKYIFILLLAFKTFKKENNVKK